MTIFYVSVCVAIIFYVIGYAHGWSRAQKVILDECKVIGKTIIDKNLITVSSIKRYT